MLRIVWCWTYRRLGCHRLDRSGRVYTRHTSILWLWCSCRSTHARRQLKLNHPLKVKARLSLPCLTLTLHHNQGNQSWQEEQEWQAPPHSQLKNELGCETLCYCTCFSLVLCVSGNGGISFSPVVIHWKIGWLLLGLGWMHKDRRQVYYRVLTRGRYMWMCEENKEWNEHVLVVIIIIIIITNSTNLLVYITITS